VLLGPRPVRSGRTKIEAGEEGAADERGERTVGRRRV